MNAAEDLLRRLEIEYYTKRHLQAINEFIDDAETDITKLLNQIGIWDEADLVIAEKWRTDYGKSCNI